MARVAWTARLRPEKINEYLDAHAKVWPELLSMLKEAGIRNYSIYLFGDRAFGYYECDDARSAIAFQDASEINKKWSVVMKDLFDLEVTEHGATYLPEIFRLD
ncbi:MAG TPA: L-rhamnose mutarotase [Candidatus Micrarchaeaceae archaeon]|nr:L-rhamnose mutarotase [Candidatus Micrarchaeaceae archaeon]